MKSGILLDSYRLPLIRGLEAAAVAGVDGVQFYAKGGGGGAHSPDGGGASRLPS